MGVGGGHVAVIHEKALDLFCEGVRERSGVVPAVEFDPFDFDVRESRGESIRL